MDISVIVVAHNEGRLAHNSMNSVFRAIDYAGKSGVQAEMIVVLDRPDEETEKYFSIYEKQNIIIHKVDFGDLGLSRNFGVKKTSGKCIAFLDGDDLFGKNWLEAVFNYLEKNDNKDVILHPEYNIVFAGHNLIWHHISSTDENFNISNLMENNYWSALCAAKREIFLKYPYEITGKNCGFGYEDWHFNCVTLANGIEHMVLPETVHFIRRKKANSLLNETVASNMVLRKNKLFEPEILKQRIEAERNLKTFAYYPFNGNSSDESGNEQHGIVYNAFLTSDRYGRENQAFYFNGKNSYIKVNLNKIFCNKYFSVSLWLNVTSFQRENYFFGILCSGVKETEYFSLSFFKVNDKRNRLCVKILDKTGILNRKFISSGISFEIDRWYHVFCVIDTFRGFIKVYLDDLLIIDSIIDKEPLPGNPFELCIGYVPDKSAMQGKLDEIRIYNSNYKYD